MMRVVLHPGPHKTATTMVQSALKASLGGRVIEGNGDARHLPGLDEEFRAVRWAFVGLNNNPTGKRVSSASGLLREFVAKAEERGVANLVMSDENFLGHPPSFFVFRHGEARYYRHNIATAEAIAEALSGRDVEVLFTTRKQETLFSSHYMDGIRWIRLDMDLDEFWEVLRNEGIPALRFDRLIAPWREIFGATNVSCLSYELLLKSPDTFMAEITRRFHLPEGSLTLPEERVNSSMPGFKIQLSRQLFRDISSGKKDRKLARRELLRADPLAGQEDIPRPRLSSASIDQIRAAFQDDISYQESVH
ncbi:hypothetical protein [Paracoccus ravus]|uniref:hypothetical protein n=1 Tax=Paracoccus ravus TaxID=2447760 RepID=UPI00106E0F95|nr:hypothetical protein [Paracoccus ravus]